MPFNHLNYPESWKEYFSKYPNGLSLMEALIQWVSQVNDMTDVMNNWTTYLDQFVLQFDTNLQTTVNEILVEMEADGRLQALISEVLETEIDQVVIDLGTTNSNLALTDANVLRNTNHLHAIQINAQYPPSPLVGIDSALADNSARIQAMIDAAPIGAEIFIPVGTWKITNPIIINKNQITLKGAAQRSIIQNDGTGDAIQIPGSIVTNLYRIKFDGLRVVGNALSGIGLNVSYVGTKLIIRDCEFSGHGDAGCYIDHSYSAVIESSNFSSNCQKVSPSYLAGLYAEYANNLDIIGCHFTNNATGSDGLRINNTLAGLVAGCQAEDNGRYGINIQSCRGLVLDGNYIENNGIGYGSSIYSLYLNGTAGDPNKNIVVNGGIYNGADLAGYGITIAYSEGTVLNGLHLYRNNTASIRVASTSTDTVITNISTSTDVGDADPILVSDAGVNTFYRKGNLVSNNVVMDTNKCIVSGGNYLWVDTNGMLRKHSTQPTNFLTDGFPFGLRVGVPASAIAAGTPGMWASAAGYLYICNATNTWQRVAIATW